MKLALFDLDNTLLDGDSDASWANYLIEIGVLDKALHQEQNDKFFKDYQRGELDIYEWLRFQLAPLAAYSLEQLFAWRESFISQSIRPIIRQEGVRVIEHHRTAGDQMIMVTATNDFVTAPIAELFHIPTLIATVTERDAAGLYTGHPVGTPSFREGKITRLNEWLAAQDRSLSDYDEVWFYSDSHNDIPLLSVVTHPVAVNPDEKLLRHAQEKGWRVADFNRVTTV
jgi:HAD superfamily hydrolase (TIGR01490 family)